MIKISIKSFDTNVEDVINNQKRLFKETQKMADDLEQKQKKQIEQQMLELEEKYNKQHVEK